MLRKEMYSGSTANVLVEGLLPEGKCFNVVLNNSAVVDDLKDVIYTHKSIPRDTYYLTAQGTRLADEDTVMMSCCGSSLTVLRAYPLLYGGKGGFGTLIRAMGTQINKGASKGACRDLTGRRMRDVNAEKRMAKWAEEGPERNRELVRERKRKAEQRRREPKHHFTDSSYVQQIKATEEGMDSALQQGLKAATTSNTDVRKRNLPGSSSRPSAKKPKLWLGIDEDQSDSDDQDDSEGEHTATKEQSAVDEGREHAADEGSKHEKHDHCLNQDKVNGDEEEGTCEEEHRASRGTPSQP